MKNISKVINVVAVLFITTAYVNGQNAINASGGNATGTAGSSSFSVGQVFYTSAEGSGVIVAQGVQQAYEVYVTHISVNSDPDLSINVFPNPATDYIILDVQNFENYVLDYQLVDNQGNIIDQGKVTGNKTKIELKGEFTSLFFLNVSENNERIKVFKIVKK